MALNTFKCNNLTPLHFEGLALKSARFNEDTNLSSFSMILDVSK